MYNEDTIVAISTPPGRSALGIIRLSGSRALEIAARICEKDRSAFKPKTVTLCRLFHPETEDFLDQALVTYFKAPKSYTGEDLVEFSCHGSPVVLSEVLQAILSLGARTATPGEFTMRAFLNGRIDLSQAEAIADLIDSRTSYQARLARQQLEGSLSSFLKPLKERLIELIVHLESSLEFVEDDITTESRERISEQLSALIAEMKRSEEGFAFGRIIREGINLAIVGKPNVGKSSIFNCLLKQQRAIVTDIPGTTRDTLSEKISLRGIPVNLVDTAGLRFTEDIVERLGVERSYSAIADADLILVVLDSSGGLDEKDLELFERCKQDDFIVALNKSDLRSAIVEEDLKPFVNGRAAVRVSARTGSGIDWLEEEIFKRISSGRSAGREDFIVTNARHQVLIKQTIECLCEAQAALNAGYSEEVVLVGLHRSLQLLGEITGETLIEDILNKIFSTFCIGK